MGKFVRLWEFGLLAEFEAVCEFKQHLVLDEYFFAVVQTHCFLPLTINNQLQSIEQIIFQFFDGFSLRYGFRYFLNFFPLAIFSLIGSVVNTKRTPILIGLLRSSSICPTEAQR